MNLKSRKITLYLGFEKLKQKQKPLQLLIMHKVRQHGNQATDYRLPPWKMRDCVNLDTCKL